MSTEQIYREVLSRYLVETLDLDAYDEQLSESDMHYLAVDDADMTEAQKADQMQLEYIYLRNELHTDRLTETDADILTKEAQKGELYSEKSVDVIARTFADVITPEKITTEEEKQLLTTYDLNMNPNFVTMDTLVLYIGTMSEFDENGNYVDQEHEEEKSEELLKFCAQMEEELNGKLGEVPIRVFSVK